MLDEIGGAPMSTVSSGTTGRSSVVGADPGITTTASVVKTSAGAWMTPIVGVVGVGVTIVVGPGKAVCDQSPPRRQRRPSPR